VTGKNAKVAIPTGSTKLSSFSGEHEALRGDDVDVKIRHKGLLD
jgi:hypothetical protein